MQVLLKNTRPYALLEKDSQHGSFSHAYLLLSPDEETLRDYLRFYARAFFFGNTRALSLIEKEGFCDCLFFPKEGKKLSVEDASLIVEEAGIRPLEGDRKVFVVDGFHTASAAVQNKLLKILEEPPEGVHFLLGAATEFSLLPTVLSRVKKLDLPPFSPREIEGFLDRNYPHLSKEDVRFFAAASCGKLSSAKAFIGEGYYKETVEDAFSLLFSSPSTLAPLCKKVADKGRKELLFSVMEFLCRDAAFLGAGKGLDAYLLSPFYKNQVEKLAKAYPVGALIAFQQSIRKAEKQLKFNANFAWCLQILMIDFIGKRKG